MVIIKRTSMELYFAKQLLDQNQEFFLLVEDFVKDFSILPAKEVGFFQDRNPNRNFR